MAELTKWDSFYVIVGSAAGALIGLQFVVMTLIAERPSLKVADAGIAFSTPTVVYFGTTLLLAAVLRAPWETILPVGIACGIVGICGFLYGVMTTRQIRRQNSYRPELEDWLFHAVLPIAGYLLLTGSAVATVSHTREALFGIASSALLLLFIGIHNSWDAVVYHVFFRAAQKDTGEEEK